MWVSVSERACLNMQLNDFSHLGHTPLGGGHSACGNVCRITHAWRKEGKERGRRGAGEAGGGGKKRGREGDEEGKVKVSVRKRVEII